MMAVWYVDEPGVGHHREDSIPVEFDGLRRGQIARYEDEAPRQSGETRRIRGATQVQQDAANDVVQVAPALTNVGVGQLLEEVVKPFRDGTERPLGVDALAPHDVDGPVQKERILEHQEVGIENVRVWKAGLPRKALLDGEELLP